MSSAEESVGGLENRRNGSGPTESDARTAEGARVSVQGRLDAGWLLGILTTGAEVVEDAEVLDGDALCRHFVVPPWGRPRFLLPAAPPEASAAALRTFNRLRPAPVRATRAGLGLALGRSRFVRGRWPIGVVGWSAPDGASLEDHWLPEHLRQVLGEDELLFATGVRTGSSFSKPVLQLFRPNGNVVGYAKVGWNPVTIRLVQREARALAELQSGDGAVATPRLLHAGTWADRFVCVTAPLPGGARSPQAGDGRVLAAALAVVESGTVVTEEVQCSSYWRALSAEADGLPNTMSGVALRHVISRVNQFDGSVRLRFGRWHGDWVTWNLAWAEGRLWAWDWEYSDPCVPAGFDLVHHVFQEEYVRRRRSTEQALGRAAGVAASHASLLGLSSEALAAVLRLHRAEVLRRDAAAEALGGDPDLRLDRSALAADPP